MLVLDGIYKERVFFISFPIKDDQERNTETRLRNTPKPTSLSLSFSDGLKFRICCKKYCECCTSKKNKNNNKSLVSKLLLVLI